MAGKKKVPLSRGRIARLDACAKRLEGKNPAQAAAELARLMRLYRLRKWQGRSLGALDMQANTLVYLSDVYYTASHWLGPSDHPRTDLNRASHSQRIVSLYTPSWEQALVLRGFKETRTPRARQHIPRNRRFTTDYGTRLEIHRHRLPFAPQPAMQLWIECCKRQETLDLRRHNDLVEFMGDSGKSGDIADAMFEVWRDIHGPASLAPLTS